MGSSRIDNRTGHAAVLYNLAVHLRIVVAAGAGYWCTVLSAELKCAVFLASKHNQ